MVLDIFLVKRLTGEWVNIDTDDFVVKKNFEYLFYGKI